MKNIESTLKRPAAAGFSLVEMLVVITVIGLIAAIAIPNIGSINSSARVGSATRNAQTIATMMNAAIAAGWDPSGITSLSDMLNKIQDGSISPTTGPFKGKVFSTGTIEAESLQVILDEGMLLWDDANDQVTYIAPTY